MYERLRKKCLGCSPRTQKLMVWGLLCSILWVHVSCQVWDVFGEKRVGLFALKPIRKDAELTVDYSTAHVGEKGVENHCESRGGKANREVPFRELVDEVGGDQGCV